MRFVCVFAVIINFLFAATYNHTVLSDNFQETNEQLYKMNIHEVEAIYNANEIVLNTIEDINSAEEWHNKFFYLEGYTIYSFNKFLFLYQQFINFENYMTKRALKKEGYDTDMNLPDETVVKMKQIKQNIDILLTKNPRNFNNFNNLLGNFKHLLGLKYSIEKRLNLPYAYSLKEIYNSRYKVHDNKTLGNVMEKYTFIELDSIFLNKLDKYIVTLKQSIVEHIEYYLRFFTANSIKNISIGKYGNY